jgi:hypothetical protein
MIQANPTAPKPIAVNITQENTNPTHNNTIDRVVEKHDPINDEMLLRTRAIFLETRGRGRGDARRSCVRTWRFSPVESKSTSTADAATDTAGSSFE